MRIESISDLELLYNNESFLNRVGRNIVGLLIAVHKRHEIENKEPCMGVESLVYLDMDFNISFVIRISRVYKLDENKNYQPVFFDSEVKK